MIYTVGFRSVETVLHKINIHLDIVHHLQVEVVFGAFQDQGAAHVGCCVVEVKDDIVGFWASFGSKYPVDLLGPLHLVGQIIPRCATGKHSALESSYSYGVYTGGQVSHGQQEMAFTFSSLGCLG